MWLVTFPEYDMSNFLCISLANLCLSDSSQSFYLCLEVLPILSYLALGHLDLI